MMMTHIRTVLVEDDKLHRKLLALIIQEQFPILKICHAVGTLKEARRAIDECKPELLIADVRLPGGTLLDLLHALPAEQLATFELVAISAVADEVRTHIQAFITCDVLAKPYDDDAFVRSLHRAVQRVIARRAERATQGGILKYFSPVTHASSNTTEQPPSVLVNDDGTFNKKAMTQVAYCQAEGNYTRVVLQNGSTELLTQQLGKCADALPAWFVRVHRSFVVNVLCIKDWYTPPSSKGLMLRLHTGEEIPVSPDRKADVLDEIEAIRGLVVGNSGFRGLHTG
jgi:two-component system LytT family response regulator